MTFQKNQMEDYQIASDKIRLFTMELPKFDQKKLDRRNMLDVWMAFLKNPQNEEVLQFEEVHQAFDTLKEVSADEEVREIYELRRKTEEGLVSEIAVKTAAAKKEGREEGEKIGEARGIEKGEKIGENKKAIEVARNLLKMGLTVEQVAQGTGLSIEEIKKLKSV